MSILKKVGLPMVVLLAFVGCDAIVEAEIKLSDILKGAKTHSIQGDLYVGLLSCTDYEDSRKPSESLDEVRQTVPGIFTDAKYVECFTKELDSFAHFTISILVDKDDDGKYASDDHINIITTKKIVLGVGIPPQIKSKLDRLEEDSYGMNALDLIVKIKLVNDTKTVQKFKIYSAYLDDEAVVYGEISMKPGSSTTIKLSDVSVSSAMEVGLTPVLEN